MGRVTPDGFAFEGPSAPTKHFKGIGGRCVAMVAKHNDNKLQFDRQRIGHGADENWAPDEKWAPQLVNEV